MVIAPGLSTYRFEDGGGEACLHLRVSASGGGTLFVDAWEAVHLNKTAATMAHLVLERVPRQQALRLLAAELPSASRAELARDYDKVAGVLRHLSTPHPGCATCNVSLDRSALFSTPPDAPYRADLALTYACNNRCTHCYNEDRRKGMDSLPVEAWRHAIDRLHQIGVPHLVFTGGEPTLFEGLPRLVAHAHGNGQLVGMNTNGRRLADKALLDDLMTAGLDHAQVTLESPDAETHNGMVGAEAFDETSRGIRNAVSAGLHAISNTTLTRRNAEDATRIVEHVHAAGLRALAMNGMIHSGRGAAHEDSLTPQELAPVLINVRETAEELGMRFLWYTPTRYCELSPLELDLGPKRCTAAEYAICVEPNGDVLPCQSWYAPVGNLLKDDWGAVWESEAFRGFRERTTTPTAFGLPAECTTCPDLLVCAGGCPLTTLPASRRPGSPLHHCH